MTIVDGSTLSAADLVALVEADSLTVDAELHLLDADESFVEDITADFVADGSSVERGIYRSVHGTATLNVTREIAWGRQRLRPFLLLSADGATWFRWVLGTFIPSVPERVVEDFPTLYSVQCFDKLDLLNQPHGASLSVESSANVVAAVAELITGVGETKINIEASTATLPATRVFSMAEDWTTLGIINELLSVINFRAIWVDAAGFFRSGEYVAPADLPTVWGYDADDATTTVGEQRVSSADFYRAANEVVGVRDAIDDETPIPVEGDGIHVARNQSNGPTSVDERGGRVVRRVIRGEYADQAALVSAVEQALERETRVTNYVSVSVSPSPVHGHFDVVSLADKAIPLSPGSRFLVTDWTLPLDGGGDMQLSLRAVN